MTRLKQTMINFKIPRYKAHQKLVRYKQNLKTWRKWKYSKELERLYIDELCRVIANALHNGGCK